MNWRAGWQRFREGFWPGVWMLFLFLLMGVELPIEEWLADEPVPAQLAANE